MRIAKAAAFVLLAVLASCSKRETAPSPPASTSATSSRTQPTGESAAFWQWFVPKKDEVAAIKKADEPIANELATQLHKVDKNLTFEIGIGTAERELIISADGLKSAFPAVKRVVAAAPPIPGWKVIAFRPRKAAGFSIELGDGTKIEQEQLSFRVLPSKGDLIDIAVYVKNATTVSEPAKKAVYLQLDALLGEYDVEMRLGGVEMQPGSKAPPGARPFRELVAVVDAAPAPSE